MNLRAKVVHYLNPAAEECINFWIDGNGAIKGWNESALGPQPSQTEIDAAMPLAKAAINLAAIRAERDRRLSATDYMATPDYPAPPAGLAAYRQALRDFPATVDAAALSRPLDVNALNWPAP